MTAAETQLADLIAAIRAFPREESAPPRFERRPGEASQAWLTQLSHARAEADERAIRYRHEIDRLTARLFGASVAELLPSPHVDLVRSEMRLAVPTGAGLADLVPALVGVAPRGPRRRMTEGEDVRVRVIAPAGAKNVIVRVHGGAFWMGGGPVSEQVDGSLIDHVAVTANAVVFDIDHRLAPEHPYPAAIIDVLCMLDAIRTGAAGVNAESSIALLGTSSGANIITLAARADGLRSPAQPLTALALVAPSVLLSEAPRALRDHPEAWALRVNQLRAYLGSKLDPGDPWVSPGAETRMAGMPPTFAAIAEYDEVAAGGAQLCDAIAAGGTPAETRFYPMTHTVAAPAVEASVIRDVAAFLHTSFTNAVSTAPRTHRSPSRT